MLRRMLRRWKENPEEWSQGTLKGYVDMDRKLSPRQLMGWK